MHRKSISLSFLDSSATFFSFFAHFFGRALSRSRMAFFFNLFTVFWMRSWRNAWHCLFGSRRNAAEGIAGTLISSRVNVIELYVINIWRKIKFNKRKVYHQFVFFFFSLIKPALKNLDKLNDVVTELLVGKKIKSDQHNAASPLYFFFKLIINNFKSFIPGTSNVVS